MLSTFQPVTVEDARGLNSITWVAPRAITYKGVLGSTTLTFNTDAEASAFFLAFTLK